MSSHNRDGFDRAKYTFNCNLMGGDTEEEHIRLLLDALPASYRRMNCERERPDCEVEIEGEEVGIEHTRLMKESQRARDRYIHNVSAEGEEVHKSKGLAPARVRPDFSTTADLDLSDAERIAQTLVDVVEHRMPQPSEENEITKGSGAFSLPGVVSSLIVKRRPWINTAEWVPSLGKFVSEIPLSMIRECVEEKSYKREGYEEFEQMWLVMVFNQTLLPNSAWFSVPDSTTAAQPDSNFDRVFLLDVSAKRAYPLSNLLGSADERPS